MKFYISATCINRIPVFNAGGGAGGDIWQGMKTKKPMAAPVGRRLTRRSAMLLLLGLVMLLPTAFLVLESAAHCSSSIGCITWKFFSGSDAALLREELMKAFMEKASSNIDDDQGEFRAQTLEGLNVEPISFKDLVNDMISNRQDIKSFAIKTKTMIENMEDMVERGKVHESKNWHIASHGVPRTLHCLSLKLAEDYAVNAVARCRLPPPQHAHRLADPLYNHVLVLTDNVLAASVVVSSAVKKSINPERLVFHVVTDKKSYTSMHSWFAVNMDVDSAVVEVKGLHQYDWSHEVNVGVKEMMEIHHQIWKRHELIHEYDHKLDVPISSSCHSLLNHLRIYLPQLFPDLEKVVLIDDDIVVQHDLSSLWEIDLNYNVLAAVLDSGTLYNDYFNFTQPIISSNLDQNLCAWLPGMNLFDLAQWRNTNITATYHHWLKLNLNSGFALWQYPGALPPALIAFRNYIHALDPTWHLAGLGRRYPNVDKHAFEAAKVLHFSGPAKPWLEIASPEVRRVWYTHVNLSNEYVNKCGITG